MKSTDYITIIIGLGFLALSACAEVPIAKTNCWSTAGSNITASTMGAGPETGLVSRADTSSLDVIPCK